MDGDSWAVDVLQALAVPVSVLIGVIVLRRPLGEFLISAGGRINKLSVGGIFSVELSAATEIRPSWTLDMNGHDFDVRQLSPADIFDSYADSLLRQLADPDTLDYAVVDLGTGESWLTSRLYLFAELLHRMRGLRAFVFVHTTATTERRFLGVAGAESVRWRLAQAHPELELHLARACNEAYSPPFGGLQSPPVVVSDSGAIESWQAGEIARLFLDGLQQLAPPPSPDGWVELERPPPDPIIWERASWLDSRDVTRILGTALDPSHIVEHNDRDIDRAEQVRQVVASSGDFMAVVRDGRFDRLIDRHDVVEQVSHRAVTPP